MRNRIIVAAVASIFALAAAMAAWTVLASAILCKITGQMAAFAFPYDEWWQGLAWFQVAFRIAWLGIVSVIASGILAALPLLAIGALVVLVWWRRPVTTVYGKTAFATQPQMQAGGLSTSKKPF